jgi:hypothetical protein
MPNPENLIPQNNRTKTEQTKIATMGGIASGKARREKRDRHQRIKDLFALAIENPKYKDMVAKMGIDPSEADLETAMDARVALELLRKGDYKAWEAMKAEAYGKLDNKTSVEVSGEVSGINININRYDKEK